MCMVAFHVCGGAKHGFANPNDVACGLATVACNWAAHHRSWRSMLAMFVENIGWGRLATNRSTAVDRTGLPDVIPCRDRAANNALPIAGNVAHL